MVVFITCGHHQGRFQNWDDVFVLVKQIKQIFKKTQIKNLMSYI